MGWKKRGRSEVMRLITGSGRTEISPDRSAAAYITPSHLGFPNLLFCSRLPSARGAAISIGRTNQLASWGPLIITAASSTLGLVS